MSWTELPELGAIRIGKAQPPPPSQRGFRPPPKGAASLFHDFDRGLAGARAAVPVIPSWQPPELPMLGLPGPRPTPMPAVGASMDSMEKEAAEAPMDDEALEEEAVVEQRRSRSESVSMKKMAMPAAQAPVSAGAPMPPPAPARMKAKGGPGGRADQSEALEASAELEVVLYASLRLGAAQSSTRGALSPVNRRQAFVESLQALGLVATFDVLAVVERAESAGHEVHTQRAPDGSADVRTAAGFYDYVYSTDAAVDVPSDGTFHSVPVNTRTATSDVLYVTVPREDPQVYRQAEVRNPLASPLLPGPVEVSVGGEYVLTTALPSVAPGGDFKLSLGVEQGIKVARNARFVERRSGDKVVATNELLHELALEVVNNLARPAKCEVRERVPQPAPEAEVVVEESGVKPAWEVYKQEERGALLEGGRRWRFTVEPGATQALEASYQVKLYANNELVGGNRREA